MSFSENKITEKTLNNQIDGSIFQGKLFDLQPVENKRVEVSFTASEISSDGGLLMVKDIEGRIGIIKSLVSCIEDTRPSLIEDFNRSGSATVCDFAVFKGQFAIAIQ